MGAFLLLSARIPLCRHNTHGTSPLGKGVAVPVQPPRPRRRRGEMLGCRQSQEAVVGQAFQGRA